MLSPPDNAQRRLAMWTRRVCLPRTGLFAVLLVAALVLACLPADWQGLLRSLVAAGLAPGQELYLSIAPQPSPETTAPEVAEALEATTPPSQAVAPPPAASSAELARLRRQVAELQTALAAARRESESTAGAPLIEADWVALRVLGRQARWRLPDRDLLAAGSAIGVAPHDLVTVTDEATLNLQEPRWLAGGEDRQMLPGLLALHDAAIFGRIVEVGPNTSTVERVTDPGYRDLVRIRYADSAASANGAIVRPGPQGVLEGTGEALCRVRMVPAGEPISVGDRVESAGYEGLLADPLAYGVIVKAECAADAAHWELWMAPAAYRERPRLVHVLRTRTAPEHLAGQLDPQERR